MEKPFNESKSNKILRKYMKEKRRQIVKVKEKKSRFGFEENLSLAFRPPRNENGKNNFSDFFRIVRPHFGPFASDLEMFGLWNNR